MTSVTVTATATATATATTSPAIPPPQEHHSLPQTPLYSDPIFAPLSPPRLTVEDFLNSNGLLTDQPIQEIEEPSHYKYLDTKEYADKYRRYENELKQYLMAKYFSGKLPNGVDIYEESTIIDGETIMSSKWPCTRCYADPDFTFSVCLEEEEEEEEGVREGEEGEGEESVESATAEITPGDISNGGIVPEKNSS